MPRFSWFRRQRAEPATTVASPFIQAGGRRYLADAPYALPKDLAETNRLNFQHFLLRHLLRGNYLAPLTQAPQAILDVGCGTGRWAIELAAQFPDSRVIGLDRVVPTTDAVTLGYGIDVLPPNITFVTGDILQGLAFPDASFDFVHMRLLYSAIPAARWPLVVSELVRVTRPTGWVELVEGGLPPNGGAGMDMLHALTLEGSQKIGLDMTVGARLGTYLEAANLAQVRSDELAIPLGAHAGQMGKLMAMDLFEILKAGRGLAVARGLASAAQYDQALQSWLQEVEQTQSTFSFYVAVGQRQ